jgi:immune inhibitor A
VSARIVVRYALVLGLISIMLTGCVASLPPAFAGDPGENRDIAATNTSTGATATHTRSPSPIPSATPSATPQPSATPTRTPSPAPTSTPTSTPTLTTLQALAEAVVPARDPPELAERLGRVSGPIPRVVIDTPPLLQIGDQHMFWVGDDTIGAHYGVTATLRYITPHLYMWVEDGYSISEADLRRSAEKFENETYPTNRAFFGSEWTPGVDNDPHISVFNGRVPGVAGYYYSPNQYSRLVNPFSNEREMFFINLEVRRPGTDAYDATLTHEFQHMIHWYNDSNEDTWVNEGLSMLAEQLNGYSVQAYADAYLRAPDTQLTTWAIADENSIPHYGASYLFMSYVLDRLGADTLKSIIRSDANGIVGFDQTLEAEGYAERFDDLFADWAIASYLDDLTISGGRYGYAELEVGPPTAEQTYTGYPVNKAGTVHQYGVDYIVLDAAGDDTLIIDFIGEPTTRLAPTFARSGQWAWWSNRGDDSNMLLTRAFDLREVTSATFSAWMWYDIEPDWDYAYLEVSSDGGSTWNIIETPHSNNENPNGNSLGPAYTGMSGGGDTPRWIEERVDLSAYAGNEIMIRFELVTDDAVNHPGLLIDDISIPEIDYFHDVETDCGGWEAAGFIRTDNRLPQTYLVQVIQFESDHPTILQIELDEQQTGRLALSGWGSEIDRAILVISATAPATTELAPYHYKIRTEPAPALE